MAFEKIAKIESTMLGFEDHGIFTVYLMVNYGGSGQGIGGYALSSRQPGCDYKKPPKGSALAGDFIMGVLSACGVGSWEKVKGRTVIAILDSEWGRPIGIKPLPTEPGEPFMFADWQALHEAP